MPSLGHALYVECTQQKNIQICRCPAAFLLLGRNYIVSAGVVRSQ